MLEPPGIRYAICSRSSGAGWLTYPVGPPLSSDAVVES